MENMKAVIFDMDGVIFDSERIVMEEWLELGRIYNIPNIMDNYIKCIGTNDAMTKSIMLEAYGNDFPYDEYRKLTSKWYHSKYDNGKLPTKPGIAELLQALKVNGYRIAIASSTRYEVVKRQIVDAHLFDYFDEIVCGDMITHSKPDPEIFLLACKKLQIKPEEAFVIEDSYNGIRAAKKAGNVPIMVPDIIQPDSEMRELSAAILPSLFECIDYIMYYK